MKSTGIVRRIDELGRIVIPKEIRKNLKIKENEMLEIFIENDQIILKKYSSFSDMDKILFDIVKIIKDITGKNLFITDRDKVIACSKKNRNDYYYKNIGDTIVYSIENRKKLLSNNLSEIELIEGEQKNINYYINPIINNSDIIGTLILLSNDELTEMDKMSVDIVSKIIGNYFD